MYSVGSTKQQSLGDEINYITAYVAPLPARIEGYIGTRLTISCETEVLSASLHHELNMIIMSRLPLGLKNPKSFQEGLASFSVLYSSFEAALDSHIRLASTPSRTRAILEHIYIPALHRASAFERDLTQHESASSEGQDAPEEEKTNQAEEPSERPEGLRNGTPARAYVLEHVRRATTERPHVLLAYCHCLYMALFAGGQHIKAAIARSATRKLALAPHQTVPEKEIAATPGIGLFSFDGRSTKEELELRQQLRDGLRRAEELLTPRERGEVLAESCSVFKLTRRLVDELDVLCGTNPTVLAATTQYTESRALNVTLPPPQASRMSLVWASRRWLGRSFEPLVKGVVVCLALFLAYSFYKTSRPAFEGRHRDGA
ncbi:heme oxygenase [Drechslerella dactyloides]|uniref:Heme oxygenase n=1 Tax=Drechslerella dactyloides TaxID=74499 RepID=A0AAD6NJH2_DREDA|nr:heme oxygenase [Drechslerella dactyloides]